MILLVDLCYKNNSLSNQEFVLPIASIVKEAGEDFEIKHYRDIKDKDLEKADKIILCGTALKDGEYLKSLKRFEWIKGFDRPILGICAGMQVIGLVFGSELVKAKEIGMKKIELRKKNKLFSTDLEVYELHKYSLEPNEEFETLAVSSVCVQAIKHKEKEIYGIMFHPEVRQRNVVRNFIDM